MFLAKDVADYTGETFFNVLERSCVEVLSVVMIIQAKIQLNNNKPNG